ncbi:MAG: ATP-binding protein [Lewinellaceae bacterium]|nr:ATP-binding protein [Lewinellaceae bacterium]
MTFEDIRDKWMVVGTNSKRRQHYSPEPFRRRYVGEKGIGRFATDKLGEKLLIRTKKSHDNRWLNVEINWNLYDELSQSDQIKLNFFTDVENNYWYDDVVKPILQGTELNISLVSEVWTQKDIERLYKELSKFVSPFYSKDTPFQIFISSEENEEFKEKPVESALIQYASHQALKLNPN